MFKIFFSKDKRLLSLIETFIFRPKGKTVKTLTVQNQEKDDKWLEETLITLKDSARYPKFPGGKGVVLDMLAVLSTGESVNVEMQALPHAHFMERALYYWSEIYGADFKAGEGYSALKPAYSLIFANFPLFRKVRGYAHSFFVRSDEPPHFVLTEHLGMVLVDLSRFSLPEGGFRGLLDMNSAWCYFIKSSSCLPEGGRRALIKKNEVFKVAESVLKDLSVDSRVRVLEKLREKSIRDRVSDLEEAEHKGRKAGRLEGREAEKQQVILNMLKKKTDISFISEVTGLSAAEIKKLQNGT